MTAPMFLHLGNCWNSCHTFVAGWPAVTLLHPNQSQETAQSSTIALDVMSDKHLLRTELQGGAVLSCRTDVLSCRAELY
jgi:hypothetical protein